MKYIKIENIGTSTEKDFGKDFNETTINTGVNNTLCSDNNLNNVDMNSSLQTADCVLRCNICDETFNNITDCLKHEKTHAVKCFLCNICNATFLNALDLKEHKRSHNSEQFSKEISRTQTYFQCDICDIEFTKYYKFKRHNENFHFNNEIVNTEKQYSYKCDKLSKSDIIEAHDDTSSYVCKNLEISISNNQTEFKCNICCEIFSNQTVLEKHELSHIVEHNFECDICHQTFSHAFILKKHKQGHDRDRDHQKNKKTITDETNQNFNSHNSDEENKINSYNLRMSKKKKMDPTCTTNTPTFHNFNNEINKSVAVVPSDTKSTSSDVTTGEKSFLCNICNKTFAAAIHLSNHRKVHTKEKPYTCKFCDKTFSQVANVQVHERIHTGIKPFQCNYCDKAFTQLANLQIHERTHTGVKPFQCSFCDKKFTQLANVKIHERIHTGNKPFQCNRCNRAFRQLNHLQKHEKIHEN